MHDIRRILQTAALRLELAAFLQRAHMLSMLLASIALILILADRLPAESFVPWIWIGPAMILLCVGAACYWTYRRRRSDMQVALQVDERLDLREKLSTALTCQSRSDAFARAAIEDAVTVARDPRTLERTRRLFRPSGPRGWWVSPLIILAAILTAQLRQFDLFSDETVTDQPQLQLVKAQVQENLSAIIQSIEQNLALKSELDSQLADFAGKPSDSDPLRTSEQIKRDAIKKVTDLSRKLEDIIKGEKGRTSQALEELLARLKPPADGPAREFAESLQKGDFDAAQDALKRLMEQSKNGELTPQQQEQLAQQLQQLADQLNQLAQQQQQLQQVLQAAGMDPNLAKNPQALQQAIQNNQNLNQQQKQQIQQMAQAQQQCNQMMQNLGQACQNMAQGLQGGAQQQMQQAGQMAQQQLGQMEQLQQLMQQAQATMNQCMGQCKDMGQGLSMQQAMQGFEQGAGMGNWGQGSGVVAPVQKTPSGFQLTKADVKTNPSGEIIAKQVLFDGPVVKGESRARMTRILNETLQGYDEAQLEEEVPVQYRDAHKHYFGELEKKVQEVIRRSDDTPPSRESDEKDSGGS